MNEEQQGICASPCDNQDGWTMFYWHVLKVSLEKGVGNCNFIVGRWIRREITVMQPTRTNRDRGTPVDAIISCGHQFQAPPAKVHYPYLRRVNGFLIGFIGRAKERESSFGVSANQ